MLTSSAKAKGRKLQNWVVELLLKIYPQFSVDDIRGSSMGQNGEDILLSTEARNKILFSIECKSSKAGFSKIYGAYEQARGNAKEWTPVVVVKQDRKAPLAVVDAEWFFRKFNG